MPSPTRVRARLLALTGALALFAGAACMAAKVRTLALRYEPTSKSSQLRRKLQDVRIAVGKVSASGVANQSVVGHGVSVQGSLTDYVAGALRTDLEAMGVYDESGPLQIEADLRSFNLNVIGRMKTHVKTTMAVTFRAVDRSADRVVWEDGCSGSATASEYSHAGMGDEQAATATQKAMQECLSALWDYNALMDVLASGSGVRLASSLTHRSPADAFFGGSASERARRAFAQSVQTVSDDLGKALGGASSKGVDRLRVAVIQFDSSGVGGAAMGEAIAEELVTGLTRKGSVDVIERKMLDRVMQEQKFGLTDLADVNTAVELGRLLAVRAVITGSVTGMEGFFRVNARAIDVETGRVLGAAAASIDKS
jgi:TolB-like protein